jgi:hypothetical protein
MSQGARTINENENAEMTSHVSNGSTTVTIEGTPKWHDINEEFNKGVYCYRSPCNL